MAIALGVLAGNYASNDNTQSTQIVRIPLTLSGNYGGSTTHGDTVDFGSVYGIQSSSVPIRVFVYQQPASGTAPLIATGTYCPGTTRDNGVISFFNGTTELTGGSAYTGAAASAVWFVEAIFQTFI
jgi:hypothetical protein